MFFLFFFFLFLFFFLYLHRMTKISYRPLIVFSRNYWKNTHPWTGLYPICSVCLSLIAAEIFLICCSSLHSFYDYDNNVYFITAPPRLQPFWFFYCQTLSDIVSLLGNIHHIYGNTFFYRFLLNYIWSRELVGWAKRAILKNFFIQFT